MMNFLQSTEIEAPESFLKWRENEIKKLEENGGEFDPENKYFNNVSEVYEYYAKVIPNEIWFEFSLYLAKVIDYYQDELKSSFQGFVL